MQGVGKTPLNLKEVLGKWGESHFLELILKGELRFFSKICTNLLWRRGVVVITTEQLHSIKPELRFCAGLNPACDVPEIQNGENL